MAVISEVPPPISTTRCARGSMGLIPQPSAPATGSGINPTFLKPASWPTSSRARRSSGVAPAGTEMTPLGRSPYRLAEETRLMTAVTNARADSRSTITPSRNGRTGVIPIGVRPTRLRASVPIARARCGSFVRTSMKDGSFSTMPSSGVPTTVLAVPRSIPSPPTSASIGIPARWI